MSGHAKTLSDLKDRTTPEGAEDIYWIISKPAKILLSDPRRLDRAARAVFNLPMTGDMSKYRNITLRKCVLCIETLIYKSPAEE